ncbi:helix-turn-helix transcriptional regulator [Chitinophaga alhagiae]|uniref:helix-turn-helix transcriptional regulator n=1 Tax=Chitinophaga alhagiae TaxID=2203219 RepID=UPI000E5B10BA|nr:response regulator transcription factor [Chitinophaga alhagiae]
MKLDIFSLVVLLGALQALFFGIFLLFAPSNNRQQNRMLAFFILILSYNGFETLNWSSGLYRYLFVFDMFPFVLIFGLGPSFYLYFRSFRAGPPARRAWRHFLPVLAGAAFRIGLFVLRVCQVNKKPVPVDPEWLDGWYGALAEPLSVLLFTVYLFLAFREYRGLMPANIRNGAWVEEEADIIMRWLKTLLVVMALFSALWAGTLLYAYVFGVGGGPQYYMIEVCLVMFIYWVGFAGYHRTRVIYIAQQKKTQTFYDQLPPAEVEACVTALEKAMAEQRLYLDPELTTNALAAHIGVPAKMLSAVLNQRLQKGFNEYVNTWRVEAVKERIKDPASNHLTLTGMAFECGFNSQPTFQRAFKAITGQTPREYQAVHLQNRP